MLRMSLLMLGAAVMLGSGAAAAQPKPALTVGTVDSLWSPTLKEQRPLLIYTPPSYGDTLHAPRRYPVVYLLDGDAHFHSFSGIIQALGTGVNGTYAIPEMIIVALPNTDRTRDLTPTTSISTPTGVTDSALKSSGGGDAFLRFLQRELIPHIDSTYRTLPYRVLVGHSFGGLIAIHALYTIPEAFNAYLAIDPSLWWDGTLLLKQASARLANPALAGRMLYLAQANTMPADSATGSEHFVSIARFDHLVRRDAVKGLGYRFHYYGDDDHGSVPLIAEYDGLRFFFEGAQPNLAQVVGRPASLVEHYRALSSRYGVPFSPPEDLLEFLAQYLEKKQPALAIEAYRANARAHEQSARAWRLLGEAYTTRHDTTRALAAYAHALAARPADTALTSAVARLTGGAPLPDDLWYLPEVDDMLAADSARPPVREGIVFTGSSTFRLWNTLAEQMAPLPVVNRGFGGAETRHVLRHLPDLVLPLSPRLVVYYAGTNDAGHGRGAAEIVRNVRAFREKLQRARPGTPLLFLSIIRSPARREQWATIDSANAELKREAGRNGFEWLNVNPALVDARGEPVGTLFQPDSLHLTPTGYERLTSVVKPAVERLWKRATPERPR